MIQAPSLPDDFSGAVKLLALFRDLASDKTGKAIAEAMEKYAARVAEAKAAVETANSATMAAQAEAEKLLADARTRAQAIEATANDSARKITAEAIQAKQGMEASQRAVDASLAQGAADQVRLDDALARVRQAEDDVQVRLASLKDSQAEVEALRQRLSAAVKAAEAA